MHMQLSKQDSSFSHLYILISLLDARFSNKESLWRSKEEQAYIHFIHFIDECEGMLGLHCN